MSGVPYVSKSVEVAALDVLCRCGWRPVDRAAVDGWFTDRSRHAGACPCWRCRAAKKSTPERVWGCLQDWRRAAVADGTALLSGAVTGSLAWLLSMFIVNGHLFVSHVHS